MPFCAVGLRRHGVRMPPAEGGRQVALWKVWDGGNRQPLHHWLAMFCFALLSWSFAYFPLTGSTLPSLLPRASSTFMVLQEGRGGADQESRTFLLIKSFHFTMKKTILIFSSLNISQGYLQKKNAMSTFHPKKCSAIFLSLKNIPLTLHRDCIIFIIFIIPSTVCLMSGPTPSFGGGWRQISGFEWPDCARQQQSLNRV